MPTDTAKRLELPPVRTYELPGGPLARDLAEVEVAVLAEFQRGSAQDGGTGSGR